MASDKEKEAKKLAKKEQKEERKRNRSKLNRTIRKVLLGLLIAFLFLFTYAVIRYGTMLISLQKEAKDIVDEAGIEIFKANQTSIIYDNNGNEITSLIGDRDSYYIESSDIPYFVKEAFITTEDRNFYEHSGVDYSAILRATVELVKNKGTITQGGSTITQQLAKNVFLTNEVSMKRKLKEMFIARELEKKYTKDQILEFYVNNIYFANGFYGIQAAAKGYFSKPVTDLTLAQLVFLCAIPNNPSIYDPYINSDKTNERKNRILKQMLDEGNIDKQMYEEAITATIVLMPSENKKNNYVETFVRYSATIALMKHYGFEFKYKFNSVEEQEEYNNAYYAMYDEYSAKLYTGGYRIYTSIDLAKQEELQNAIDDQLSYYSDVNEEGIYTYQGAATCIDNATGKVVAIVGGRSQEYKGYTLNRAYQSYRQPGSTIKPILVYTPAFERGYTPDTVVVDEPIQGGPVNAPQGYDGEMKLRRAVEVSKNTVAWKLLDMITPAVGLDYLLNMDFKNIVASDYVPAVSIGGMTYGISPIEMASAFSTLENDGVYRTPTCINKITNSDYDIIIDNINYTESESTTIEQKQIYQTEASRMMTDVLKGVLTNGTGRNYNITNAICAAKTGTTNDNKDVWFVGYSKYYTTSVWSGYDLPKEINDGYGTTCSGTIWKNFMTKIHEGLQLNDFVPDVNQNINQETTEETEEETTITEETIAPKESTQETVGENTSEEITQEVTETMKPTTHVEQNTTTKSSETAESSSEEGLYTEYWGE